MRHGNISVKKAHILRQLALLLVPVYSFSSQQNHFLSLSDGMYGLIPFSSLSSSSGNSAGVSGFQFIMLNFLTIATKGIHPMDVMINREAINLHQAGHSSFTLSACQRKFTIVSGYSSLKVFKQHNTNPYVISLFKKISIKQVYILSNLTLLH